MKKTGGLSVSDKPFKTDCIPVCLLCLDAGKCDKIWARNPVSVAHWSSSKSHRVIRAAIEAEERRYWELPCGHYTHHQEQELYSAWKPKGKDWFCDRCGHWVAKPPRRSKEKEDGNDKKSEQETIPF